MNRQAIEQMLVDLEVRDAARRVIECRPLGWSDFLRKAGRHEPNGEILHVIAMVGLIVVAAAVFWYGSPVPAVVHRIHDIARGF